MRLKNSANAYGLVSISIHWIVALVVFSMFGVGLWMVELGYYDTWYHKAPALHKSVGIILFAAMVFRVLWRLFTRQPKSVATHSAFIRFAAKAGHLVIYLMLFGIMVSGYLISTADGVGIPVFGMFEVPALIYGLPDQADIAGEVHLYLAWGLMAVVAGHALAALKHHWIDKDITLVRMFGRSIRKNK